MIYLTDNMALTNAQEGNRTENISYYLHTAHKAAESEAAQLVTLLDIELYLHR